MKTAQADTTIQATDYPQWVIVENAGTDTEDVCSDHHKGSPQKTENKAR